MHFFYFYEGTSGKSQGPIYLHPVPSSQSVTFFPGQVGPYIQVEKDKGIFHDKEPPAPVAAVAPAAPVVNGADNKEANGTANGTEAPQGASVASQSGASGGSEPTTLVEAAEAEVQNVHRFCGSFFLFLIFWNQKSEQKIGPFSLILIHEKGWKKRLQKTSGSLRCV